MGYATRSGFFGICLIWIVTWSSAENGIKCDQAFTCLNDVGPVC